MEANIIVKGLLAILVVVGLLVGLKSCGDSPDEGVVASRPGGDALSAEEMAALGIEADTPDDVVATLIHHVRQLKDQVKTLEGDNTTLKDDNQKLASMEQNITSRLESALTAKEQAIERRNQAALKAQATEFNNLLAKLKPAAGGEPSRSAEAVNAAGNGVRMGDTYWVTPLEGQTGSSDTPWGALTDRIKHTVPTQGASRSRKKGSSQGNGQPATRDEPEPPIPYYTIAKNATLVDTTAMTALIGRVPVGDNITDPYFFKVIIGRDNLIANGHELPEVAYAIASGESYGDWTLSCVRGAVFSITFVFNDGTIRTVPKPKDIYISPTKTEKVEIGQLSDRFGNPCVPGQKKTNAGRYLAQRFGANAAEAAALAAASSETTQFNTIGGGGFGSATVVDGSKSKYIWDQTLAGGARETAEWIRERQALEFDAIYAPPGHKVAIHINEQIDIDYDPQGRKTDYGRLSLGGEYRELD